MQAAQEDGEGCGKLAHAATIDEDLHHCRHRNGTEREREDDGDTQHLPRVVEHAQNTGGSPSHVRSHGAHDGVGVGRGEEARSSTHQDHVDREQPVRRRRPDCGEPQKTQCANRESNGREQT